MKKNSEVISRQDTEEDEKKTHEKKNRTIY